MAHFGVSHLYTPLLLSHRKFTVDKCNTPRSHGLYITYTTPVVEIKSATLWYITDIPVVCITDIPVVCITDIPHFVATLTIYGVTSHIP